MKKLAILIIITLVFLGVIPGGVQRASADNLGNILAYPQTGYVELGNCPLADAFTLTVVDGTSTVYTSDPITCMLRADGYQYAGFQVVDYTLKPGDILTVSNGTDSKELVITPEGTHSVDLVADTIQGVNQGATHLGVWSSGYWLDVNATQDGSWLADFSGMVDLVPGMGLAVYQDDGDGDFTGYNWDVPFPTSGSATGEGWITSPAGAYVANPAYTGKATLEFDAKYGKSSPTLKGTVVFTFKGFKFLSTFLDWQAIEGERMQLTGNGTINGKSGYGFMIDAAKNRPEAGGKDTFRIRIWDTASGQIVYDNMPGAADYVIPVTPIQGGTIILTP